jgi:hypothetical protein
VGAAHRPGWVGEVLLANQHERTGRHPTARHPEVVRLYGLRNWVEQGYKQVKGELGWADFQVRSDRAIRRHEAQVGCAFSFCWQSFLADHPTQPELSPNAQAASTGRAGGAADRSSRRNRPCACRGRRDCAGCGPG